MRLSSHLCNMNRIKVSTIVFMILVCLGCATRIDSDILGVWNVQSDFYRAKYKIEQRGNKLVGALLYYNDDTKELKATHTDQDIFLKNLKKKNGIYIDAISGATITNHSQMEIMIKSRDTLEVSTHIMNQQLKEFWIREK